VAKPEKAVAKLEKAAANLEKTGAKAVANPENTEVKAVARGVADVWAAAANHVSYTATPMTIQSLPQSQLLTLVQHLRP
jgi:hypothetical protein